MTSHNLLDRLKEILQIQDRENENHSSTHSILVIAIPLKFKAQDQDNNWVCFFIGAPAISHSTKVIIMTWHRKIILLDSELVYKPQWKMLWIPVSVTHRIAFI